MIAGRRMNEMTQLNISLSDAANQFVADQVATGQFESPSDYVQKLIEKASARDRLERLIEEGESSGPGTEYSEEQWAQRMNELRAQVPREPAA
jgi:putative addiction module CopG family antidote